MAPPGWSIADDMQIVPGGIYLALVNTTVLEDEMKELELELGTRERPHLHWGIALASPSSDQRILTFVRLLPVKSSLEKVVVVHNPSEAEADRVLRYKLIGVATDESAMQAVRDVIEDIDIPLTRSTCPCLSWACDVVQALCHAQVIDCHGDEREDIEGELVETELLVLDDKRKGYVRYGVVSWLDSCI